MIEKPWKPSKEQIEQAAGKTVPDIIAPGLSVLFCGINPGLYTAAVRHHFARPGNRFWQVLYRSGFTSKIFSPFEEDMLPSFGIGITNLVERATSNAAELTRDEFQHGETELREKVFKMKPRVLAVLGVGAYKMAFRCPGAKIGLQEKRIGETALWVLPNPSGINASYQIDDLIRLFQNLYNWIHF